MPIMIHQGDAAALAMTLQAIQSETAAIHSAGRLAVCADDLLGATPEVHDWLCRFATATHAARDDVVVMPDEDPGCLQHVVYAVSAVLVWADDLHRSGVLETFIDGAALRAWAVIEDAAGFGDRTARALDPERTAKMSAAAAAAGAAASASARSATAAARAARIARRPTVVA